MSYFGELAFLSKLLVVQMHFSPWMCTEVATGAAELEQCRSVLSSLWLSFLVALLKSWQHQSL